jgi:hypothetical protein
MGADRVQAWVARHARVDIARRLLWRRTVAIVGAVWLVLTGGQFLLEQFGPKEFASIRLGDNLPHLGRWTWAVIGLVLLLILTFEGALREIGRLERKSGVDRSIVDIGVDELAPAVIQANPNLYQAMCLITNNRPRQGFEARIVSKSVKGIGEEFPQGGMAVRWQQPTTGTVQEIPQGQDWRLEIAWFYQGPEAIHFLGPDGAVSHAVRTTGTTVEGLIDILDAKGDGQQRMRFVIGVDPAHPPWLTVEKVASPMNPAGGK